MTILATRPPIESEETTQAAAALLAHWGRGPAPEPTTELTVVDGYLVDEQGEVHGHVQVQGDFHVTTQSAAEWVLQRMMEEEAQLLALDSMERAIASNIQKLRGRHANRRRFLDFRFRSELEAFARANLRGKLKTWSCPYGKVSFRNQAAGVEITDEPAAIAWAKALGRTDAVKTTEKLLLSKIKDAILADPPPEGHGLAIKEARETVSIDTGIQ